MKEKRKRKKKYKQNKKIKSNLNGSLIFALHMEAL
jgi:hypothetical protein